MDAEANELTVTDQDLPEVEHGPNLFDGESAGGAGAVPSQTTAPASSQPPEVPESLRGLLSLRGVPQDLFGGVNIGTAWIRAHQTGCDHCLPLAHLAPDAIETLAEIGYTGQVRAELRAAEKGPVLRYFAFRLPEENNVQPMDPQEALARRLDRVDEALVRLADAVAMQAQQPARGAGGLASLDVSTIRDLLALAPQLRNGGKVLKELLGMFGADEAPAAAPVSGEDQAQVISALIGGLRSLMDSELAQELLARVLGRGKVVAMRGANAS